MDSVHQEMLIAMVEEKIDGIDYQIDSSNPDDVHYLYAKRDEAVSPLQAVQQL